MKKYKSVLISEKGVNHDPRGAVRRFKGCGFCIRTFESAILVILVLVLSGNAFVQEVAASSPQNTLVVGTKEAPPFSMKTPDGRWTGISIDLWKSIASELNLSYEFRELDLKQLIEGVADRSLDVAVAALTITPDREKIFDFTHTYYTTGLGIAVASKSRNPWLAVMRRLVSFAFFKILLALALLLLAAGFLVWWFERKRNSRQFNADITKGIGSGFWWSAVTMTTVGYGDKAPITAGGRMVAIVWMFVATIALSAFTAAITSFLTVSQLESVVKGPEDLPKVIVGTLANTTSASYLKENRISYQTYQSLQEGLTVLNEGSIDALVYDAPMLRYMINQKFEGVLHVLPDRFNPQNYGIALQFGSRLRESINVVLLSKIQDKEWQDKIYQYLGDS